MVGGRRRAAGWVSAANEPQGGKDTGVKQERALQRGTRQGHVGVLRNSKENGGQQKKTKLWAGNPRKENLGGKKRRGE